MTSIKILLFSILLPSCTATLPFTSSIQKEYHLTEVQLKKVQFYTSDEIVLLRTNEESDVGVDAGKLLIRTEKDFEKIIIPRNSYCVLEQMVESNKFLMSLEVGGSETILFGYNIDGYYSLMAKDWKGRVGTISYGNKTFVTTNGSVYLNIKARQLNKLGGKWRRVHGRRI